MAHQHNQIRRHQRKKNHANHRTTAKHNQKPPTNSSGGNRGRRYRQIKTLDSVSVRNIVATLPYSSTARNDGPGHFPALAGAAGPVRARLTDCGRGRGRAGRSGGSGGRGGAKRRHSRRFLSGNPESFE